MTLNKAAAPTTRSAMPAATGNISSSSSRTGSRASRWFTNKDQKVRDGFSTKMEVLCTNFFVPKKKRWDLYQVRLFRCGILPSSLRVLLLLLVSLAGLPLLASCFFFAFSCGVAPNPRILSFNLRIQHSNCLWFMSLLSFTCTLSSSQDSMHCTLSFTVCTCTPCQ